jgi:hypothetical protein
MSEMSQTRLRILEARFFTLKETCELLDVSTGKLWMWRKGSDTLDAAQLKKLEAAVLQRIYQLTTFAVA